MPKKINTLCMDHDTILKGNPAANVRGLCDQTRENTKSILLHDQDHKDHITPILEDYTANKNKFEGAYKLILFVVILMGIVQGLLTWQQTINAKEIKTYMMEKR